MCGLFGVISEIVLGTDKANFVKQSYLSATRGIDSTGFLRTACASGGVPFSDFIKSNKNPIAFSAMREVREFLSPPNIYALMGHTRAATRGEVTADNAHPFLSKDGRFTMFHNGTLTNMHKDYETDSEWMCNKFAENKGNIEDTLKTVYGAYAIVLFDDIENKISIVRNSDRTLYTCEVGRKIWYASEGWMLIPFVGAGEIKLLPPNEVLEISLKKSHDFTVRRYSVNPRPTFQKWGGYGWSNGEADWSEGGWAKGFANLGRGQENAGESNRNVPVVLDDLLDPDGSTKGRSNVLNVPLAQQKEKDNQNPNKKRNSNVVPLGPSLYERILAYRTARTDKEVAGTRQTYTADGEPVYERNLKEIGFTTGQIDVIMSMEEEFTIDSDLFLEPIMDPKILGRFILVSMTKDRECNLNDFMNRLCDGCGLCGNMSEPDNIRHWSSIHGTAFVCESCDNNARVISHAKH